MLKLNIRRIMYLIADSGSTKTDWALIDGATVAGRFKTQGINPFHQNEETMRQIIRTELLPQLDETAVVRVFFYGSGCRMEFVPLMQLIIGEAFPHAQCIEAYGDLLGAARAVCGGTEGIACILGTGANSCLYDGERIVMNTPPLGYILGDEGSGAVLGKQFLNALFKNQLPASLRDDFLVTNSITMGDVIHRVYCQPLANRFLASVALYIHDHLDVPQLNQMVIDNFRNFFQLNVLQYGRSDLKVGAVGGMAYYFSDQLKTAAAMEGFDIGEVMRTPIRGLISYHSR